jgi:hypothetical protein
MAFPGAALAIFSSLSLDRQALWARVKENKYCQVLSLDSFNIINVSPESILTIDNVHRHD